MSLLSSARAPAWSPTAVARRSSAPRAPPSPSLERAGDELERQARAQDRTLAVGAVPLYGDPLVIVAAPGHPLGPLLPLRLADLTAARIEE